MSVDAAEAQRHQPKPHIRLIRIGQEELPDHFRENRVEDGKVFEMTNRSYHGQLISLDDPHQLKVPQSKPIQAELDTLAPLDLQENALQG